MLSFVENLVAGIAIGVGVVAGEKAVIAATPKAVAYAKAARAKATEAKLRLQAWNAEREASRAEARVAA
jgi:hypothetical protein